ncbi:MAG TPA: DUF2807 domain-containing protein [Rhizomicrobium sp.]|nr:DUF2807 domain-containing protein [Rhizomicrobium sp.]
MLKALFASAALLALTGAASAQTAVPVPPFTSVELRGGGHVVLKYGPAQRVTLLKGDLGHTSFEVRDGHKLVIDACNRSCWGRYDLEIEIVTPRIAGAAVDGGGHVESAGGFPAQGRIDAAVEGGGHVDLRTIDAASAEAAVDGGGHVLIRAEHALNAAVNGGGSIEYWGNPQLTSAVNGGGSVSRGS